MEGRKKSNCFRQDGSPGTIQDGTLFPRPRGLDTEKCTPSQGPCPSFLQALPSLWGPVQTQAAHLPPDKCTPSPSHPPAGCPCPGEALRGHPGQPPPIEVPRPRLAMGCAVYGAGCSETDPRDHSLAQDRPPWEAAPWDQQWASPAHLRALKPGNQGTHVATAPRRAWAPHSHPRGDSRRRHLGGQAARPCPFSWEQRGRGPGGTRGKWPGRPTRGPPGSPRTPAAQRPGSTASGGGRGGHAEKGEARPQAGGLRPRGGPAARPGGRRAGGERRARPEAGCSPPAGPPACAPGPRRRAAASPATSAPPRCSPSASASRRRPSSRRARTPAADAQRRPGPALPAGPSRGPEAPRAGPGDPGPWSTWQQGARLRQGAGGPCVPTVPSGQDRGCRGPGLEAGDWHCPPGGGRLLPAFLPLRRSADRPRARFSLRSGERCSDTRREGA